jgi:ATP-dependent DNA helicase RecG
MSAKAISEKISEKTSEKTSEKFTVTDRTIESDLAHLKKIGILVRKGGRKDGYWKIITEHDSTTYQSTECNL